MKKLDEETQIIAVERVLDEIKKVKEIANDWNGTIIEQLSLPYCIDFFDEGFDKEKNDLVLKYSPRYVLDRRISSSEELGIPLAKEVLVSDNSYNKKYDVSFGKIDLFLDDINNPTRKCSFRNNGDVIYSKHSNLKLNASHPKNITYNTKFNVLDNDFDINVYQKSLRDNLKSDSEVNSDLFSFSLENGFIIETYNNMQIIRDLENNLRTIKIDNSTYMKRYVDRIALNFEATLNSDNSLKNGSLILKMFNDNGVYAGCYKFQYDKENGINTVYSSSNDEEVALFSNLDLAEDAYSLLGPVKNSNQFTDMIIASFINSLQKDVFNTTSDVVHVNVDVRLINKLERKLQRIIKSLKLDIPSEELISRIDNAFHLISNNTSKVVQIDAYKM
jgi:hypothetical protein